MDAKAPRSVWLATSRMPHFDPLPGDLAVDVAIVGAGITGLTAAALLADAGRTVAVLEMDYVAAGTTGHTTAHLDVTTDAGLEGLLKSHGAEKARMVIDASRRAIEQIEALVGRFRIECNLRRVPSYVYAEDDAGADWLEREAEAAQELGVDAALLRQTPLPFAIKRALRVERQGRMHAGRYIAGLAGAIASPGCRIFGGTRVEEAEDGEPCRVRTNRGTVTARDVILATHTPVGLRPSVQTRLEPWRSYVIGARLAEPFPDDIYWDTADPYNYLRRYDDEDPTLLILGGADHHTGSRGETEDSYAQLEAYARQRFAVRAIEHRWSAQVFVPADDLPYIGPELTDRHLWYATGYAGTGITFGTFAGMLLADRILGRENAAAELFDPRRVNLATSAGPTLKANIKVAGHMISDWLRRGEKLPVEDLAAGEGRLLNVEGDKVAAFRDEKGVLHLLSPVCPHMKCIVHWNSAEKTWDCPCHGSIFAATGEVLTGPAMHPLSPLAADE